MKNKKIWFGMLVMVLVFGMLVVGCDNDTIDDNGGTGGSFTLTNIPSKFNGKYAMYMMMAYEPPVLVGVQSVSMTTGVITLVQIFNGSVSLPMWVATDIGYQRFSGNRTVNESMILILNTLTFTQNTPEEYLLADVYFESITFSNGNVTKS